MPAIELKYRYFLAKSLSGMLNHNYVKSRLNLPGNTRGVSYYTCRQAVGSIKSTAGPAQVRFARQQHFPAEEGPVLSILGFL